MATDKELRFRILASITGSDVIGKFNKDLNKASVEAEDLRSKYTKLSNGVKALASAWVVKEILAYTKSLIDMGAELDDLSEKTGIAVETLGELKALADIKGKSFEELAGFVRKLNTEIIEAGTGGKEAIAVFKAIGVSFKDDSGKLRDAGSVMKDIADKFSKMENGAAKSYIAMKLFGKSGAEFIPFLNKGASELSKFSYAIDDDFAKRASRFNDTLAEMKVSMLSFHTTSVREVLPAIQDILDAFKTKKSDSAFSAILDGSLKTIIELFRIASIVGNSFLNVLIDITDIGMSALKAAFDVTKDAWNGTSITLVEGARAAYKAITGDFAGAQQVLVNLKNTAVSGFKATGEEQLSSANQVAVRYQKRWADAYEFTRKLSKNSVVFGAGDEGAIKDTKPKDDTTKKTAADLTAITDLRAKERDRVKEFIEQQILENKQRKIALSDIYLSQLELKKVTEARALESEAIKYSKTMTKEQREELMKATAELIKHREEVVELEFSTRRTFEYGARNYFRTYLDEATNAAKNTERVFNTAFTGLENSLTDFVKTGKLNFKDFADSVISELIRISIRQAILVPLAKSLGGAFGGGVDAAGGTTSFSTDYLAGNTNGFATGGVMTNRGPLPLNAYSSGGIANTPQFALFGEGRTPEAYVPLPDGKTIPVTMKSAGGSNGSSVNVSINIDNRGNESSESDGGTNMKQLANMIKGSVINVLQEQKRPGGLLAAV